jgi:RHH-type proline utilization regulon transcriptional repressor/proline dehydrogenase/delta 1-pyrroline-5-carboxylate dehydrogenase
MPFLTSHDPAVERRIREIGGKLFELMEASAPPAMLSKRGAYARIMEWSMRDPAFKTQLFRFVDVLPSLKSSGEIVRHLQEYLGDKAVELNPAMKAGLAASSFAPALVAGPVKANVIAMARQFVAGETPEDLVKQLQRNSKRGIATTIDLLGETVVSEAEANVFLQRNLEVLDTVSAALARDPTPGFSDLGPDGPLPRLNLSVKISALTPDIHPADPENSIAALKKRLRLILRRAIEVGAFVNFDMESYKLKDLTLALFKSILEEPDFRGQPAIGIAIQAYLRDAERDLRDLIAWARRQQRRIAVRLVKGAYWDYENILAQQRGWPIPVWSKKSETDANFETLSLLLLEHIDLIAPAFATHNVRSCAHAIAQAERLRIDPRALEFQALYGMADDLKSALVQTECRVREYCAIGELLPGMAYLVRRLLENTSNEGFLRQKIRGEATKEQLLAKPNFATGAPETGNRIFETGNRIPDTGKIVAQTEVQKAELRKQAAEIETLPSSNSPVSGIRSPVSKLRSPVLGAPVFQNVPNTDFSLPENRERQRAALATVTAKLGEKWPLVIGGKKIADREWIASRNPARPAQVLGYWSRATLADADAAIAAAREAFPAWRSTPADQRARLLERAADLLEARRFELNALEILEAGKPWLEADADISEAIDFCRFYAVEMRALDQPHVTQAVPGERCVQRWTPRGVGVVIAPWNFPLAILCGMTVAAVVGGNAVIMKPAEQTSLLAAALMTVFTEAGFPNGVVNLLTGHGEDVGAHLVAHPQIDFIAFTGSRAVGLKIWETAGRTLPGQTNLKKVVCEMGGKNALIIDNDADIDEAIPATLYSAFGFSGQKCSALSRLIVLEDIHDEFVERLIAAAAATPVGDPARPGTVVGPVIDGDAQRKILGLIEQGRREATLAWQAAMPAVADSGGYFVPPTIFTEVKPDAVIAREEIFGPVLAVIKARDLDAALAMANSTDYALTGGLFSRSPHALERASREFLVGNLYLNRSITGAIVERHPFGGFKMSGGGTKAGGRGYIENFLFPRVIAENVLRRGFTPEEGE